MERNEKRKSRTENSEARREEKQGAKKIKEGRREGRQEERRRSRSNDEVGYQSGVMKSKFWVEDDLHINLYLTLARLREVRADNTLSMGGGRIGEGM